MTSSTDDSDSSSISALMENLGVKELIAKRQARYGETLKKNFEACKKREMVLPEELRYVSLLKHAFDELNKDYNDKDYKLKINLEVKRENRKTHINVVEIAEILNRDPEFLVSYINNDLSVSGSINKEGKMVIKGTYMRATIIDVLRRYIEHFVACKVCDSAEDTEIIRDKKLYFLKCNKCGASKCVGNILHGLKLSGASKPKLRGFI